MEHSPYGLRVTLPVPFDTAVADATAALKAEGFGVLTTIDVQHTLKTKLNRDFRKYMILGACNPALADRALQAELEIGLLLPCNVIVYEAGTGQSVVAAMAPLAALGVVGANSALQDVARERTNACGEHWPPLSQRPRSNGRVTEGERNGQHVHGARRLRRVDRSAVLGPASARCAHVSRTSAARVAAIKAP